MIDKFTGRWFHCLSCDRVSIECPHCDNTSCNGGGCDLCHDDFKEVAKMSEEGNLPDKNGLPKKGGGIDIYLEATTISIKSGQPLDNNWIEQKLKELHEKD